jgi:hypothetical protein
MRTGLLKQAILHVNPKLSVAAAHEQLQRRGITCTKGYIWLVRRQNQSQEAKAPRKRKPEQRFVDAAVELGLSRATELLEHVHKVRAELIAAKSA